MKKEYNKYIERYLSQRVKYKRLFKDLKSHKKQLDLFFHQAHHESFDEINCLECANCCNTISPIFRQKDIERLSRALKLKPHQLIERYLYEDKEGDFVLNESPCPFLMKDNYCMVYNDRPSACREFPHTDHVNMHKYLKLAEKNCTVCPAVASTIFKIEERLK